MYYVISKSVARTIMSLIELHVELPAYSRSFPIKVYNASTILQVKQEICRACPGQPRVEGQRLIWRGRSLLDHERVEDLWKVSSIRPLCLPLHSLTPYRTVGRRATHYPSCCPSFCLVVDSA